MRLLRACWWLAAAFVVSVGSTSLQRKEERPPSLLVVIEPSLLTAAQPVLYHLRNSWPAGEGGLSVHPLALSWHPKRWFEGRAAHELLLEDVPEVYCEGASPSQRHACAVSEVALAIDAVNATAVMVFGSSASGWAAVTAAALASVPVIAVDSGWPTTGLPHMPSAVVAETRRRAIDAACDLCFTATPGAVRLLTKQGVPTTRIRFVGSPIVDSTASVVHQAHYYTGIDFERYPFLMARVTKDTEHETGIAQSGPTTLVPAVVQRRVWRHHVASLLDDAGCFADEEAGGEGGVAGAPDGEAIVELAPGEGPGAARAVAGADTTSSTSSTSTLPRAVVTAIFEHPLGDDSRAALAAVVTSNYYNDSGGVYRGAAVLLDAPPAAASSTIVTPDGTTTAAGAGVAHLLHRAAAPFKGGLSAKETILLVSASGAVVTDSDSVKVTAVALGVPVILLRRGAASGSRSRSAADTDPGLQTGAVVRVEPGDVPALVVAVGAALHASAASAAAASSEPTMGDILATASSAPGVGVSLSAALALAAVRLFPTGAPLADPLGAVFTRVYGDGGAGYRIAKLARAAAMQPGGVPAYVAAHEERWGPEAPATRIRYHRDRIAASVVGPATGPGTTPPFFTHGQVDAGAVARDAPIPPLPSDLPPLPSAAAPAFHGIGLHRAHVRALAAAASASPPPVPLPTNPPVLALYPVTSPSPSSSSPPPSLPLAALASTLEQPYEHSDMLQRVTRIGLPPWHTLLPNAVTVVLTVFKRNNLQAQVEALLRQTHPPHVVYVLQNGNFTDVSSVVASYPSLRYIASPRHNWMFHGRLMLASLAETEYFMVFDDDILPQRRWIENCIRASREHHAVVGSNGRRLNRGQGAFYEDGRRSPGLGDGNPVPHDTEVDLVGHSILMRSEWAVHLWGSPAFTITQGEDFAVSATAALGAGIRAIVPRQQVADETMSDTRPELGMDAVASYKKPSHQRRIDIGDYYSGVRGWVPLCQARFDCEEFLGLFDDDPLPSLPD